MWSRAPVRPLSSASRFTARRSRAIWKETPSTAMRSSSCLRAIARTARGGIRSSTPCMVTPLARSSGRRRFTCRSRGLVGHSMGGYGATRIGMKHADVFGSLYIMSPCCMSARAAGPGNPENEKALEAVKPPADSATLPFGLRAQLASAAAWSPNPKNPPLYLDLPIKDGVAQPDVLARWTANAPLAFVDQYVGNLRQYRGISIDVG